MKCLLKQFEHTLQLLVAEIHQMKLATPHIYRRNVRSSVTLPFWRCHWKKTTKFIRFRSRQLSCSRGTLYRKMVRDLPFYSFKIQLTQELFLLIIRNIEDTSIGLFIYMEWTPSVWRKKVNFATRLFPIKLLWNTWITKGSLKSYTVVRCNYRAISSGNDSAMQSQSYVDRYPNMLHEFF